MTFPPARLALGLAALAVAASVWAAGPVDQPPAWASLTPAQQATLAPLQHDWASIDVGRKQKWLEVARRFPNLPPAERQRIQERMGEWARMTPAERGRARLQFQETRQLSAEDRSARWEAYKALPDEQRRELARRAKPVAKAPEPRNGEGEFKHNLVPLARQAPPKPVGPTVLQAKPGATTSIMSLKTPPPAPQQPGLPKIATREFVNPNTLLPERGPQGAAAVRSPAAAKPASAARR